MSSAFPYFETAIPGTTPADVHTRPLHDPPSRKTTSVTQPSDKADQTFVPYVKKFLALRLLRQAKQKKALCAVILLPFYVGLRFAVFGCVSSSYTEGAASQKERTLCSKARSKALLIVTGPRSASVPPEISFPTSMGGINVA